MAIPPTLRPMEATIRGAPAFYDEIGAGAPIVILHGRPTDHRQTELFFEPVFAGRSGWRRIYPDLPGMGATPGPDWIASHEDVVDWTEAFLDEVVGPGQRLTLAGSSYGGWIALRLLERDAARIDGVLLQVPSFSVVPERRRVPLRRVVLPAADELRAQVAPDEQQWLNVSVVQTPETLDGFRRGTKLGIAAADHAFLDRLDANPAGARDARPPLRPFDRPALILAGRQDHVAGYADALGLAESFPRGTVAVLDRAGHGVPNEQRALFGALVGEWLDRVEEAASRAGAE